MLKPSDLILRQHQNEQQYRIANRHQRHRQIDPCGNQHRQQRRKCDADPHDGFILHLRHTLNFKHGYTGEQRKEKGEKRRIRAQKHRNQKDDHAHAG